ncbi:hypothetical protein [Sphingobacterium endophyticum]|uniref:hypothetical protein n=1 Tax=Sphingobacterium endophyticum TaxID=2546448 RepID=UPI0012E20276|nr:hypothetical protein [Sphingobacterium endophyticum]
MKENNTYYENLGDNQLPNSLRVNPFIVPENYFEKLAERSLFFAKLDQISDTGKIGLSTPKGFFEEQESQLLGQIKIDQFQSVDSFTVPEQYFDQMSEQILAQVQIDGIKEMEETEVPAGYFENLTNRILNRIEEEELSLEIAEPGFTVPEGYFEDADNQIMASIYSEELKSHVQTEGFEVPAGYFENMSNAILDKVQDKKVIQLPSRDESKTSDSRKKGKVYAWLTSAAAACVAAVIGVSVYNSDNNQPMQTEKLSLNEIPEDEIINYLSNYSDASDLEYYAEYIYQPEESKGVGSGIDEEVLEDYLNYTL